MSDSKKNYCNKIFKEKKVSKATYYNERNEIVHEQGYDSTGVLITEMIITPLGSKDFHNYHYLNNRLIVIDSIKHVIRKIIYDSIYRFRVDPSKLDTISHVEMKFFDLKNNLLSVYNTTSRSKDWLLLNSIGFCPDSAFYSYDTCWNCNRVIWYYSGTKEEKSCDYRYMGFSTDYDRYIIRIDHHNQREEEQWWFDVRGRLTNILGQNSTVSIEYHKNKIKKYLKTFTNGYDRPRQPKSIITNTVYKYNLKGALIKACEHYEEIVSYQHDKKGKVGPVYANQTEISRPIKRYSNGLLKTNQQGQLIQYIYRNQKN
jgi:hypothetical protein